MGPCPIYDLFHAENEACWSETSPQKSVGKPIPFKDQSGHMEHHKKAILSPDASDFRRLPTPVCEWKLLHFISVALHMSAFHLTFNFCAFHFAKGHINSCPLDQSPIEQKVEKPEELLRCTGHSLDDIIARL